MRKVVASILMALYVVVFLPVMLLLGFYRVFFDVDLYKGEFVELAYDIVVEEFPKAIFQSDEALPITEGELREVIQDVFSEDDFSVLIDDFVAQLDETMAADDGVVTLSLNLEWFQKKDSVVVEKATDIIVQGLEVCGDGQYDFTADFPECIPSEIPEFDFENQVMVALDREFFGDLPNEISFDLAVPEGSSGSISDFLVNSIKILFLISGLSLLFLLIMIGLLIFKPAVRVLKWVFKSIFMGATLVLIVSLILFLSPQAFVFPPEFSLYGEIAGFLSVSLAKELFLFIVPLFVLSLFLWIFTIVKDKDIISHDS